MNDTRSLVDEAEVRLGAATMADDVDVLVDTRDELLVGIERDVIRRLKRVVDDGQNDLLDRLRRARRLEGAQQILGDEAAEVDSLVESMRTELGDALEAGRRFVDLVGGSTRQDGWEVDTLVSVLGPVLRQRVALPWRALVSDVVSARLEDRSSLPEALRVAVREFRSETLPQTAGAIADAAFNLGVVASAPEGCTLEWVVDHGGEPSVQHLDPPRAGATGRVVEGIAASDLPSSCRCLAVPVER